VVDCPNCKATLKEAKERVDLEQAQILQNNLRFLNSESKMQSELSVDQPQQFQGVDSV